MSKQIKEDKDRAQRYGEVFTPPDIVNDMLRQPGIKEATHDLTTTFLEPSAGVGGFLLPILEAKMQTAFLISSNSYRYNRNALIALSLLYGIELLETNLTKLVINMYSLFMRLYTQGTKRFNSRINKNVMNSAKLIISANIVQGNALNGINGNHNRIMFSDWDILDDYKIKRVNYYYYDNSHSSVTNKDDR